MPYPFLPIQLSLIGMVVEGIPSFFLTFEPNHERIKGRFLSTVLHQAFPCALAIVINIIAVDQLAPILSITAAEVSTLCVYLTAFVWLVQLLRICTPFSRWRLILWVCMAGLFVGAVLLFPGPLELCRLRGISVLLFVLLAVGGCAVYFLLTFAADRDLRPLEPAPAAWTPADIKRRLRDDEKRIAGFLSRKTGIRYGSHRL